MLNETRNILYQRELLTIESGTITALLDQAENEVGEQRQRLFAVRSRLAALTFTGAGAAGPGAPATAATNVSRVKAMKDWSRAAERYVREKRRQIFASDEGAKPLLERHKRSPGTDGDARETWNGSPAAWRVPKVGEIDAWSEWFKCIDRVSVGAQPRRKNARNQVALTVVGGIGDVIKATSLLPDIVGRFDCDVTCVTNQPGARELLRNNPYVQNVVYAPLDEPDFLLRNLPLFDLIILFRYIVQYFIPPETRIDRNLVSLAIEKGEPLRSRLMKCFFSSSVWPSSNFSREIIRLGIGVRDVAILTAGLAGHDRDFFGVRFFPDNNDIWILSALTPKPYVTVHNGFGANSSPARKKKTDYDSTKSISTQQWKGIVESVRQAGLEVVQLGVLGEEEIPGVSHCLNGQTSLGETALLLKHALCHIDTEGGLVHLANAMHARSVVLFGPTPVEVFGYPQNINLEPRGCKSCWYVAPTWVLECPRQTSGPQCMREHSADRVAQAVNTIMLERRVASATLVGFETGLNETRRDGSFAEAQQLLNNPGVKLLLVVDSAARVSEAGLPQEILNGSDIIVCADPTSDRDPKTAAGLRPYRAEFGSLLNLPRTSGSIDAVVWLASAIDSRIAPFALGEMFRTLKEGGELFFSSVGGAPGMDLGSALEGARIAHDRRDLSSGAICSFHLRKGDREGGVPLVGRDGRPPSIPDLSDQKGLPAIDPRLSSLEDENNARMALLREKFAERQRIADERADLIDDAVARSLGPDGWIPASGALADEYSHRFFERGWHPADEWGIWSREQICVLMLPLSARTSSREESLELQMEVALLLADTAAPRTIRLRVGDGRFIDLSMTDSHGLVSALLPLPSDCQRGAAHVEIHIDKTIRPKAYGLSPDERDLGLGVRRFRYRVVDAR